MTLDEAIKHAEEEADEIECEAEHYRIAGVGGNGEKCAEELRQLAKWLRELKHLRNLVAYSIDFNCTIKKAEKMLRVAEDRIKEIEVLNDVTDTNVGKLEERR